MADDDHRRVACATLNSFISAVKDRGIASVILAWRHEWAPSSAIPGQTHGEVVFGSVREVTLLGYHKPSGTVISVAVGGEEADRSLIRQQVMEAGLTVTERCRNLT